MRHLLFRSGWLCGVLLCFTLNGALAQTPRDASDPATPSVSEPVDVGVLVRSTRAGFVPLEFHQALKDSDFAWLAGQKTYLTVPGTRSNIRFGPGEEVKFFLKVFLDSSDPRSAFFPIKDPTRFALYRLELEREERRIVLRDEGLTSVRRDAGRPLVPRIYGKSSFELLPTEQLSPGEYAIKYTDTGEDERFKVFCFGVDGR